MHDKLSSHLRLVFSQGSKAVNEAISLEIQTICRRAAAPVRPGESVKSQLRRAWDNLGRPPFWRVKAGWYADHAGNWSAAAVADFQNRYLAFTARRRACEEHAQAITDMTRATGPAPILEDARDEYRTLVARIEAIEAALCLRG